ncbi:protein-glutamine gamma-glutamyltransferase K-like [Protopterus annectens]|uniref:protein-glutamine gamma-glutamyltransferase K-like n=1 Tax=Protopterus annectens TaxID=7888 RepID=UPI001CFBCC38|nr:protein-glutamine gamma-glutamyltransferase K-like [Protopterus annectens]
MSYANGDATNSRRIGRQQSSASASLAMRQNSVTPSRKKKDAWWRSRWCCPCLRARSSEEEVLDKLTDGKKDEEGDKEEVELNDMMLIVKKIDLMKKKKEENKITHHTNEYDYDELIVRRGQPFDMKLQFNRPYNPETDQIFLELQTGKHYPQVTKGTLIIVPLVEEHNRMEWGAKVTQASGNHVTLSVNSSPEAVIGKFQLSVRTRGPGGELKTPSAPENSIYILFNPWCEKDSVFLDNEEWRKEYVLNETGMIYYGTEFQIGARTWNFAQFSKGVLDACLYVLEKGGMPASGSKDSVSTARVISAMVNSPDDDGVLEGNWSGDYSDGTSPTSWVGSEDILLQYHKTRKPVCYGQCWVFSGVTTTVLRCLGIPSRSVTNFSSAHDTDVSLTMDIFFDENMKSLEDMNYDSVWNFHVWNDCWMARPDLPPGYGGWQAVDATPQETSSGTYCCGPASILAIRNGLVFLKHDTPFIFAEVNSDKIYWQRQADGTFKKLFIEKKAIGHKISTKAVASNEREDITSLYKHPEGSEEERIAVETASKYGNKPSIYIDSDMPSDVGIEVQTDEKTTMGSDVVLCVGLTNKSNEQRFVTLFINTAMMYYTGVLKESFRKEEKAVQLSPYEEARVEMVIKYAEYHEELIDQAAMMFTISGRVQETGQLLATQQTFRLRTPDLEIIPIGGAVVGQEMRAKISFVNPLPKTLTGVYFRVEGPGLHKPNIVQVGDVARGATVTITQTFVPVKPGPRKLIASLDSRQLTQVHGVAEVDVKE